MSSSFNSWQCLVKPVLLFFVDGESMAWTSRTGAFSVLKAIGGSKEHWGILTDILVLASYLRYRREGVSPHGAGS